MRLRWRARLANGGYSRHAGRPLPSTAGVARIVYLARFARWVTVERLADAYRGHLRKGAAGVSFATGLGTLLAEQFLHLATLALLLAEGTRAPASGRAVTPPVQAG